MNNNKELYIVKFEEINYSPITEIITKHNAKVKRKYVNSKDIELIIYCDLNVIKQLKIKNVDVAPYDLLIRKRSNL